MSCLLRVLHKLIILWSVKTRGGSEDTNFEAKAKDSEKNPRLRTELPRTGYLEAKDRKA